jgi:hypothetical protein
MGSLMLINELAHHVNTRGPPCTMDCSTGSALRTLVATLAGDVGATVASLATFFSQASGVWIHHASCFGHQWNVFTGVPRLMVLASPALGGIFFHAHWLALMLVDRVLSFFLASGGDAFSSTIVVSRAMIHSLSFFTVFKFHEFSSMRQWYVCSITNMSSTVISWF